MNLQDRAKEYLEYCTYRKELDAKTVKAYRIDLKQYFSFVCCDEPEKETIERYITNLHKKYKQKTALQPPHHANRIYTQSQKGLSSKYTYN